MIETSVLADAFEPQSRTHENEAHERPGSSDPANSGVWVTPLVMGALSSAGAGLVHAAAVGTHNGDRTVALIFGATAVVQLGWAGLAVVRRRRDVAALGLVINTVALAAWALSRTRGLPIVEGFSAKAEVGTQDSIGAILAGLTLVCAGLAIARPHAARATNLFAGSFAALVVVALAVPGMAAAHDDGADHHIAAGEPASAGHSDGTLAHGGTASHTGDMSSPDHDMSAMEAAAPHAAAVVVPYDPTKPIDLGGTEGVSPEEQAAAENLVSATLLGLPQWSDPEYALANGFVSIGDGLTGTEHFVSVEFMNDDVILDPDKPESLVWDVVGGKRTLAAAMYMAMPGTPLTDVPTVGGELVQWHVHTNLCFNGEGKVRGLVDGAGNCPPGLIKPEPTPMIHVWIRKHPCGPFAALEGIGGGDILPGETKLCDSAHGAGH